MCCGSRRGTRIRVDFHGKSSASIATEPPLPISIDGEVLAQTPVVASVAAET